MPPYERRTRFEAFFADAGSWSPYPDMYQLHWRWVGISPKDKPVLDVILQSALARGKRRVRLSWAQLEQLTGLEKTAIRRAVRSLEAADVITTDRDKGDMPQVFDLSKLVVRLNILHGAKQPQLLVTELLADTRFPERKAAQAKQPQLDGLEDFFNPSPAAVASTIATAVDAGFTPYAQAKADRARAAVAESAERYAARTRQAVNQ